MKFKHLVLAGWAAGSLASAPHAEPRDEYLKVKKFTFVSLVDLLVQRGVIQKHEGKELIDAAEVEGKTGDSGFAATPDLDDPSVDKAKSPMVQTDAQGRQVKPPIHVTYVPEIVRRQIREQVRAELKSDIVKDVTQIARHENWVFSELLPDWISRIKPYFDARIRLSDEFFDSGNAPALDWQAVNRNGGLAQALLRNEAYLNTGIDRLRINERFRVGFDAQVTDSVKVGFRLTTTNQYSPVQTNQTLGNYNRSWIVAIDRAFLQYDWVDQQGNDWLTLWGGRIANPFFSTEMLYSAMLSFEGIVGTFRYRFNQNDSFVSAYHAPAATGRYGINLGPQTPDTLYATIGALPLEEINLSSSDKWLFAAQGGVDWLLSGDSRLKIGAAYYDFNGVRAIRNRQDDLTYDWTAPQFMQKGNSLVNINDSGNQTACSAGSTGASNICLVGLASKFQILNVTAAFDFARFAPIHVLVTADFAKNLGFSSSYITRAFGKQVSAKTNAYMVRLDVGRPELRHFKDWNLFFSYRYIERDSVLDAFNDPIFHQGGSDAQGWVVGAQYGLAQNTWLDLRWLSADAIDGPPLAIDTLNVDLNVRF